jgi:hypothetical protein
LTTPLIEFTGEIIMKKSHLLGAACACICSLSFSTSHAATLFFEDFEDAAVGYTSSVPDDLTNIAIKNYFGRIDQYPGGALPADVIYNNVQGSGFYGVQDTDAANSGDIQLITLNFSGIDISNATNLNLSWYVAEDDDAPNEDWDPTSSFRIGAQIDGGGYFTVFSIESADAAVPNKVPKVDTDLNGVGDGSEITDAFTQFSTGLPTAGRVLDIRITIEDLDSGDEDIAFDSLLLTGDLPSVPIPAAVWLFGSGLLGLVGVARRKVRV